MRPRSPIEIGESTPPWEKYQGYVQTKCRRFFARWATHDVEEATQTVWQKFLAHPPSATDEPSIKSWLNRTIHNTCIEIGRKNRRMPRLGLPIELEASHSEPPDIEALRAERRGVVNDLIREMNEIDKELIRTDTENRSVKEIAQTLGIPEGTVRSKKFYLYQRLSKSPALVRLASVTSCIMGMLAAGPAFGKKATKKFALRLTLSEIKSLIKFYVIPTTLVATITLSTFRGLGLFREVKTSIVIGPLVNGEQAFDNSLMSMGPPVIKAESPKESQTKTGEESGQIERAWRLHASRKDEEALNLLKSIGARSSERLVLGEVHFCIGKIEIDLNHHQNALDAFRRAVDENPEALKFRIAKADAELSLGDPEAAKATLEDVLRIDPMNADAIAVLETLRGGKSLEER